MISDNRIKEICDLYYKDVYRYCFSLIQSVYDSQDITQETFELLIEKACTLEDENIKAWLYSVALIKIKQYRKDEAVAKCHISPENPEKILLPEDKTYSIEDAISQYLYDDRRIEAEKQNVLDLLTQKERELYDEAYVKKRKYSEIARDKGVSNVTINVQAYRLRNKITALVKGIFDFCLNFFV